MTQTSDIGPPAVRRVPAAFPPRREAPVTRPAAGSTLTADEQAERAVTRAAGGMLVLAAPGVPPVTLGPYPNPDVLRARLAAVRQFVAAVIRSAPSALPHTVPVAERGPAQPDGGFAADCDLNQMTDDGCPLSPDPTRWADADWCDAPGAEGTSQVIASACRPSNSPRKA